MDRMERLRELYEHARINTNFYSKYATRKINSQDDFEGLPLLEKIHIRNEYHSLICRGTKEKHCVAFLTSGTTGIPVKYLRSKKELANSYIIMARERRKSAGVNYDAALAHFDKIIEPIKYVYKDNKKRELIFSLYNNDKERYELYSSAIKEFKPGIIQGYASSLFQLAKFFLDNQIHIEGVGLVENRSETLTKGQRIVIEKAFKSKVRNFYALAELFPIAYECNCGNLHLCEDHVYLEVISTETNEVVGMDAVGELVVTSLTSLTMPLIRYKTGDLGSLVSSGCECGASSPILKLFEGRLAHMIKTPTGDELNPVILRRIFNKFYNDDYRSIAQLQFIQDDFYNFTINVVPVEKPTLSLKENIIGLVKKCFMYDIEVHVEFVDALTPNPQSGKVSTFISKIG